ncbi:MAG TPA: tRNA pseudouridine(38-40) synthase TruA [Clostridiaceae bacterium]|nr:tRNA pseudouridine(38-40) synthase TruA [Clostridiaceae bacterium]
MRNIKLTIEYDGTNYSGWQSQKNAVAVQNEIQKAINKLTGENCLLIGAGRTDAGVHALGQVANFRTSSKIPADKFSYALNSLLPDDIVIKKSEEVSLDFHAQYSAKGKKYMYLIYNSNRPSALLRERAYFVPQKLDVDAMKKAAECFLGTHDFSAFRATGGSAKTSVRTITNVSLDVCHNMLDACNNLGSCNNLIKFEIEGNGFLYNMVRIIAGTLVEIGIGKLPWDSVPGIIESRDRKRAGRTAPPHGLYLVEVRY